jgi:hypothetical protein
VTFRLCDIFLPLYNSWSAASRSSRAVRPSSGVDANFRCSADLRFFRVISQAAFNSSSYSLCHALVGIDQHHGEFVAAVPCRQIRRAAMLLRASATGPLALPSCTRRDALRPGSIEKWTRRARFRGWRTRLFPIGRPELARAAGFPA